MNKRRFWSITRVLMMEIAALTHHPERFAQDYLQPIDEIIHMNKNKITVSCYRIVLDRDAIGIRWFQKRCAPIFACCIGGATFGTKMGAQRGLNAHDESGFVSIPFEERPLFRNQARSKRSRFITLFQAAAKSWTNFSWASSQP